MKSIMKATRKEFFVRTKSGAFRVRIWWDKSDRAYLVRGISLPEVVTFGRTLADAKRMAREAVELYCECAIDENKIVIDDTGRAFGKLPRSRIVELAR